MATHKNWIVTTSGEHPLAGIVAQLTKDGFVVGQVLSAIGSIVGSASEATAAKARTIPGVADVSPDSAISLGPPDAPVTWRGAPSITNKHFNPTLPHFLVREVGSFPTLLPTIMETLLAEKENATIGSDGHVPTGGHTPVSNHMSSNSVAGDAIAAGRSEAPAQGSDHQAVQAHSDGTEAVKGFKLHAASEA
nr:hypothetical protein [Tanacetum cinerariifolium]